MVKATKAHRRIFLIGLTVVAVVICLDFIGALRGWERESIDFRYTVLPRPSRPMSNKIVHVDIDDGAIDRIGKWPDKWPRSVQARVIEGLLKAGAKTVAIDLSLEDPSDPGLHDDRFAEVMGKTQTVLSVTLHEGDVYDPLWTSDQGTREIEALFGRIQQDVQVTEEEILGSGILSGDRPHRYQIRPFEFKRAAVWRELKNSGGKYKTFAEFQNRMAPNLDERTGYFAERPALRSAWEQHESWAAIGSMLYRPGVAGSHLDRAPLLKFIRRASGVGFVNATQQKDSDGSIRRIAVNLPAPGGEVLQFGIAAAAAHLNIPPSEIQIERDFIQIGSVRLPLRDGKLWIDWPTSNTTPQWEGLLRQNDDAPSAAGHLSIREPLELARAQVTHQQNIEKHETVSRLILAFAGTKVDPKKQLTAEHRAAVADEVDFTLADAPKTKPTKKKLTADEKAFWDHVHNCRTWQLTAAATKEGKEKIKLAERKLRERVDGRLVFVGWTATGALADFVATPVGARTPGVIVHAAVADMVLNGAARFFLPGWIVPFLEILLGALCAWVAAKMTVAKSTFCSIGALTAYALVVWWAFTEGWIFPLIGPVLAGGSAWMVCIAIGAAASQRDRMRITNQFKARVSAQLVDHLVHQPDELTMAGQQREITVMFCDLAGFTSITEKLDSEMTVSTLNRYMTALTQVLVSKDAYVNKFLGDGLMAFWSAFREDSDQASKAIAAAIECHAAVEKLNDHPVEGVPALHLRTGLATGNVTVGDCGAPPNLHDYTVIGNAVNLAARLESANKQFGSQALMDGRTAALAEGAETCSRSMGRVIVVGQTVPTEIHEIFTSDISPKLIRLSQQFLGLLADGRHTEAIDVLDEMRDNHGSSGYERLYRAAIDEAADPNISFDGILRLTAK
jgi:class 3 adenylate cyclase/CHASE2 domain-containing sensor protein